MEELQRFRERLDGMARRLKKIGAQHVNTAADKTNVQDLVKEWFCEVRPVLENRPGGTDKVRAVDDVMQELMRCTQGRTPVTRYRTLVKDSQRLLGDLEVFVLMSGESQAQTQLYEVDEREILETLRRVNASAAACYEQGLDDLRAGNRKSWRGTVVEFREALRETLDTLAPDEEVKEKTRFQPKAGPTGPTMKEKALFILSSRGKTKSQVKSAEDAVETVDEITAGFVRAVYKRASYGVHNQVTREEAVRVKDYVTLVLRELLELGK